MSNPKIHTLDARRLLCPMPVIRVQQLIEKLGNDAVGDRIESVCTDPGSLYDIPAWAKVHGHKLIETREDDYEYYVTIEICETS
ncbi:MAG: sulfurtransferase TusA family protein [Cocleimonas sp.]